MDYEKEFEKETGYNARYSQGGITRESLKYVNWLKSKCDALQGNYDLTTAQLGAYQVTIGELKAENERLDKTVKRIRELNRDRLDQLQALKDRFDNAPITTLPRNQLVGALMPEPKGDGEYISYRLVEIKGGE